MRIRILLATAEDAEDGEIFFPKEPSASSASSAVASFYGTRPSNVRAADLPARNVDAVICLGAVLAGGWHVIRYWCDCRSWLLTICFAYSGSSVDRRVSVLMAS